MVKLPYQKVHMTTELVFPPRPLPALLTEVKNAILDRFFERLGEEGFQDIREGHGCVFGFIDVDEGSRLTDLADRSGLTKQAVGEAAAHLVAIGYLERVPDPKDGRAKILQLTPHGLDAVITGRRLFAEIEREWAEQLGEGLLAGLREAAEKIADAKRESALRGRSRSAA